MIDVQLFHSYIQKKLGIKFFAGVPDSLLKNYISFIYESVDQHHHIITANEGLAVSIAAGNYLATKNIPLVYMQNSGIGNAINPLLSLVGSEVYSIPILLLIGWRAEPGITDEPQHVKQGKVTEQLLQSIGIPYKILSSANVVDFREILDEVFTYMKQNERSYAILVKKNTFINSQVINKVSEANTITREKVIEFIITKIGPQDIVVSTTGKISRELFEIREKLNQPHKSDFLVVGSMGHANHIALGIAVEKKNRRVYCLDGDGALLMHLGSMSQIGTMKLSNYMHILLNNGAHESVGGQATVGNDIDFCGIAISTGYKHAFRIDTNDKLNEVINNLKNMEGPILVDIRIKKGSRKDLGRPTSILAEIKRDFMNFLQS